MTLTSMLIRHEKMKLRAYFDSEGNTTIGVGRNLDSLGISEKEANYLLQNDIARVRREACFAFSWFLDLDIVRQDVITDMLFNLGLTRFMKFKYLIIALQQKDWERAASEMLSSAWAAQVKGRAVELAEMMRRGTYIEQAISSDST